jgi:hypothetical protein
MTLSLDSGTVVAACTVITVVSGLAGWAGRHFINDTVAAPARPITPAAVSVTMSDLEAALLKHELSLINRFNGRYPSREVFTQGMDSIADQVSQTRNYIGSAERRLSAQMTAQVTASNIAHSELHERILTLENKA